MFIRDMERIVRDMKRKRVDPEYIKHYLLETYQARPQMIEEVFKKVGFIEADGGDNPMGSPAANKRRDRAKKFGL